MPIAESPMTNKMHAVPQNIMDVEFKLIGDLTLRQFMYLLVFGGAAYVSTVIIVGIFKWPTVLLFAITGIGLAFVPIQERGLDEWIVNFIRSVYSPTQRIWRRVPTLPSAFMYENLAVVRQELITLAPTSSRRKLEEYLEYQLTDKVVDPLDIPEREYMLKVREAYKDMAPAQRSSSVGVGVLEPETIQPAFPPSAGSQKFYSPTNQPIEPNIPTQEPTPESEKPYNETSLPSNETFIASSENSNTGISEEQKTTVSTVDNMQSAPTPVVTPQQQPNQQHHKQKHHKRPSVLLSPLTPDRHSGRRFINLVPASGELVLPIRGEKVIRTSEELEVETDIQDKAQKLQQLLSQIKRDSGVTSNVPVQPAYSPQVVSDSSVNAVQNSQQIDKEAENLAQKLQGEQDRLTQEISNLESQKNSTSSQDEAKEKDTMIQRLKVEKERTQADYEALQRQILDLQAKLKEKVSNSPAASAFGTTTPIQVPIGKANVVTGSVRSKTGTTKEGVLLIIKNQKGEAVRAVKTDTLGHFKLSTPLSNGMYSIEVTGDDIGSTFDIITFEAKGEPIPTIEIFGK